MNQVSVIIPTFNRREIVTNTLLALDNQEEPYRRGFQVILVDDGSDIDTLAVIDRQFQNFTVDYQYIPRDENSGRSRARNAGIQSAKNDIVVIMDDDIIVRPNFIGEIIRGFSLSPGVLLIGLRKYLPRPVIPEVVLSGAIHSMPSQPEYRHQIFNKCSYNMNALRMPWNLCWGQMIAAPRIWLNHVGGFDEEFKGWGNEDIDLALRLYETGLTPVLNYRIEGLHQYHAMDLKSERDRGREFYLNTKLFFKKHPDALGMTLDEFLNICENDMMIEYSLHQPMNEETDLYYRQPVQLQEVKKKAQQLSQSRNMTVNLYDELEDSDLDIWVQLLTKNPGVIRYFPRSMMG